MTDEQFDSIDWKAAQKALKERPTGLRRWQAKFMTSHCATGKMMKIRKQWTHSKCPRCGAEEEDTRHVCQCPHPEARAKINQAIKRIKEWMITVHTDDRIRCFLLLLLRRWIANEPPPRTITLSARSSKMVKGKAEQIALGGWQTILGRISKRLVEVQAEHYKRIQSRRTGHRWAVELIKQLHDVSFQMWQHRNAVLKEEPDRHHQQEDLENTNRAIEQEWQLGDRGLLQQDRFLFRCKDTVENKSLEQKKEWLATVTTARAAAAADTHQHNSYDTERQGMQTWLNNRQAAHTPPRIRDDPQTTNNTQNTTKTKRNNKKTITRKRTQVLNRTDVRNSKRRKRQ